MPPRFQNLTSNKLSQLAKGPGSKDAILRKVIIQDGIISFTTDNRLNKTPTRTGPKALFILAEQNITTAARTSRDISVAKKDSCEKNAKKFPVSNLLPILFCLYENSNTGKSGHTLLPVPYFFPPSIIYNESAAPTVRQTHKKIDGHTI